MLSHSESIRPAGQSAGVSRAELVTGMQLLRAVSMQSVRLQLAMLKRNRRPTIESLDTLADMDRELEHFIEGIGPAALAPELEEIAELVAFQKTALTNEKIALMAEISGPDIVSAREPVLTPDPAPVEPEQILAPASSGYRAPGGAAKLAALLLMGCLAGAGALAWRFSGTLAPLLGF